MTDNTVGKLVDQSTEFERRLQELMEWFIPSGSVLAGGETFIKIIYAHNQIFLLLDTIRSLILKAREADPESFDVLVAPHILGTASTPNYDIQELVN